MSMSRNQKILQACVSAICIITPEIFLATSGWDRKVNKMDDSYLIVCIH
jgi:hypothetical protein